MATLPQITFNFNRQIKLSNDGGSLSSDTGIFLFREFDEKLGFTQTLANHLHLNDARSHFIHSNEKLLNQKIYQIIAGYAEDDAADQLTEDPVFTEVLSTTALKICPCVKNIRVYLNKHECLNFYICF